MPEPIPAATRPVLQVPVDIYYYDTDAGGVVHNVAYLRMVEQARTELAAHIGWTLAEMASTGLVPVVARTEIDYLKPARLGDRLLITAELTGMETIRFHLAFTLASAANPELIFARCQQTMVTVQLPGGRPKRVPKEWRTAFPDLVVQG